MLLVIHNLPSNSRYVDIKSLIQTNCGISDVILDNLDREGNRKKVTVGLADENDAALLTRKLNGFFIDGDSLFVENVRQKRVGAYNQQPIPVPPPVEMPVQNYQMPFYMQSNSFTDYNRQTAGTSNFQQNNSDWGQNVENENSYQNHNPAVWDLGQANQAGPRNVWHNQNTTMQTEDRSPQKLRRNDKRDFSGRNNERDFSGRNDERGFSGRNDEQSNRFNNRGGNGPSTRRDYDSQNYNKRNIEPKRNIREENYRNPSQEDRYRKTNASVDPQSSRFRRDDRASNQRESLRYPKVRNFERLPKKNPEPLMKSFDVVTRKFQRPEPKYKEFPQRPSNVNFSGTAIKPINKPKPKPKLSQNPGISNNQPPTRTQKDKLTRQDMTTQMNREDTWKNQATSFLAKEILKNLSVTPSEANFVLKQLKTSIRARLDIMIKELVPPSEIATLYRIKFPHSNDAKFYSAVLEDARQKKAKNTIVTDDSSKNDDDTKDGVDVKKEETDDPAPETSASETAEQKGVKRKYSFDYKNYPIKIPKISRKASHLQQKELAKLEYLHEEMFELPPLQQKALEEELETISQLFKEECDDTVTVGERQVMSRILKPSLLLLKTSLSLNIKKRLLNVTTNLVVKLTYKQAPKQKTIPFPKLNQLLAPYGVKQTLKSGAKKSCIAVCDSYPNFDRLLAMKTLTVGGVTLEITPVNISGFKPSFSAFEKIKNKGGDNSVYVDDQITPLMADKNTSENAKEIKSQNGEPQKEAAVNNKTDVNRSEENIEEITDKSEKELDESVVITENLNKTIDLTEDIENDNGAIKNNSSDDKEKRDKVNDFDDDDTNIDELVNDDNEVDEGDLEDY